MSLRRTVWKGCPAAFLLLALAALAGCGKAADSKGTPVTQPGVPAASAAQDLPSPVPLGPPGTEVASVKQLAAKMGEVRKLSEMAPFLTNETAAMMGTMVGGILYASVAMAEGFGNMAQGMGASGGKPPVDPKAQEQLKQMQALKGDLEGVFKRYNVDLKNPQGAKSMPPELKTHGRRFFADVAALLERMPGAEDRKIDSGPGFARNLENMTYTVVSPTVVKVADKRKPAGEQMEVRAEDGGWRVHIPAEQLMKGSGPGGPGPTGPVAPAH